ncbi:MAG: peptidase C39 family protein [Chloroflexales bacterium]|nr:peptidase C39 family protein [Chloroflexales bacterium]
MTPHFLIRWAADAIATWAREAPTSADGPHARIALCGPVIAGRGAIQVIPTWATETPPGTWVEAQLRVGSGEAWAKLFRVAVWDSAVAESRRTSFGAQTSPAGYLSTDTLMLAQPAAALQARVLLCAEPGAPMPELESLALCLTARGDESAPRGHGSAQSAARPSALRLPLLISQHFSYPDHAPLWSSPTALAMVLAYWHERTGYASLAPFLATESVPAIVAPMVYDPGWDGTGNWAFNTAFAASLGLTAYVTRIGSLAQLARWTDAGVPVPICIRWGPGELDGATGRSAGHITVVTGLAGERVLVAEPAARDPAVVARSYRADQLYACWQRASGGAAYLIHPQGWRTPRPGDGDAWT